MTALRLVDYGSESGDAACGPDDRSWLRAVVIAPAARAWMGTAGQRRVAQVFPQVCNLVDDQGRMLSVVRQPVPLGPFSMAVQEEGNLGPDFTARTQQGDRVAVRGPVLTFGKLHIDTTGAEVWQARPDWPGVRLVLKTRLSLALSSISGLLLAASPESLASPTLSLRPKSEYGLPGVAGAVHRAACPPISGLKNGLRSGDLPEIRAAAAGLAGLGPGLTPAGDDFLVGALLGLWAAWPPAKGLPLARLIVCAAAPRTTRLSAAWLDAAGRGETDAVWHDLLASLSTGRERELNAAGQRILARGHTSGADALAGFWMALSASHPDVWA